ILDVLRNYTPYDLAFRLAHDGKEIDHTQVERSTAMKGIMQWVRLHPYNIAAKVQIVVEHYRENVQPLLDGRARRWWWCRPGRRRCAGRRPSAPTSKAAATRWACWWRSRAR